MNRFSLCAVFLVSLFTGSIADAGKTPANSRVVQSCSDCDEDEEYCQRDQTPEDYLAGRTCTIWCVQNDQVQSVPPPNQSLPKDALKQVKPAPAPATPAKKK